MATSTSWRGPPQRLRDPELDEGPVDFDERPVDFDERDFDELDFEALLREPEPLDFDEVAPEVLEPLRDREPLDFEELRVPPVFPRADPLLELFELPEELFDFALRDVADDPLRVRWDLR